MIMLSEFKNPPIHSRVSPLWSWNARPDPEELERQIREMHRKGVGGFVIVEDPKARAACGEREWGDCLGRARSVAVKLGMLVSISQDASLASRAHDGAPPDVRPRDGQLLGKLIELPTNDSVSAPALMVASDWQHTSVAETFGAKLGVSTAHCAGINRVACAPFASHCWADSMEQMKGIVDRAVALGVNVILPTAWPYSLSGSEAHSSVFYQSALWPHFRRLADYSARLCYALSQGSHRARIALLNPINSFVYERSRDPQSRAAKLAVDYFNVYCEWLLKEHLDYDIICEESLSSALAVDQRLMIGDEEYSLLVMPPVTAMTCPAADKIAEYAQDGGAILASTLLPIFDPNNEQHEHVRRLFSDIFGLDPSFLRNHVVEGLQSPRPRLSHNYGNLAFYESPNAEDLIPGLRQTVSLVMKPEVSIRRSGGECHDIIYQHRVIDDHDLFFFANMAPVTREVKITLRCDNAPYVLDPETGSTKALPNCVQKGSRTVFAHRFQSHESLLVYFTSEMLLPAIPRATSDGYEIVLSNEWKFNAEGHNCFPLSDWAPAWNETRRVLTKSFDVETPPDELLLVLRGCSDEAIQVSVNGKSAPRPSGWLFDPTFGTIDIAALVTQGTNEICLDCVKDEAQNLDIVGPSAMLAGTFSLNDSWSRLLPVRTSISSGSWADHGYPFYSGTAVYSQTVDIPAFHQNQTVLLRTEEARDVVEFLINGASAGVRAWTPYELDITHLAKPGPNSIEIKVTNTSANAIGFEPSPSGLLSGARLIIC